MREYLDKFMAWLMTWVPTVEKLGFGVFWTLPFGNDGRGTKVYLWPFVALAIFFAGTLIHYKWFA